MLGEAIMLSVVVFADIALPLAPSLTLLPPTTKAGIPKLGLGTIPWTDVESAYCRCTLVGSGSSAIEGNMGSVGSAGREVEASNVGVSSR